MDERQIEQGLRDVLLAEPPLGIDPDQVADVAARHKRGRAVGFLSGVGVLVIAGLAAGAVVFTGGVSPGPGPSTGTIPVADPTGPKDPVDPAERNVEHLRAVLATLLPDAHDVQVGATWDRGKDQPQLSAEVTFTDAAGPARFTLTVSDVADTLPPLGDVCENTSPGAAGLPADAVVRCDKTQRPGGGTLVVMELGSKGRPTYLHVMDYRAGHHSVSVSDDGRSAGPDGHALTDAQAIALATDGAFAMP